MFGIETLGGTSQAAALVGLVFVEAMVLYVGYGVLESVLGPAVMKLLGGE
ncbi:MULTISPECIES: hypothetical protein [Haloferax]|nr:MULTISPECIES: hypothetical protein [Haloferax]